MELECGHVTGQIIAAAIRVHRALGPGLLESVYETCLAHELVKAGLRVQRQVELPVVYDTIRLDCGFRIDLLVDDSVVIELKAVEKLLPIHEAQLMTYLRLASKPVGLLINFNVHRLRDGIIRRALTRPRHS
jgi:GxxExxY protein